ncbi:MAG: hypothetical protein ACFUZC_16615 [Chthoniobacteraceae bacterium]
MEPLTLIELTALKTDCPRRDNALYLGDCVIRKVIAGETLALPDDFVIEAGIGTLKRENGRLHFVPAIKKEWPVLARPLKLLAAPGDAGLGDIVARVIGPIGGDAFKAWYKRVFGRDCKCQIRQATLNLDFPL